MPNKNNILGAGLAGTVFDTSKNTSVVNPDLKDLDWDSYTKNLRIGDDGNIYSGLTDSVNAARVPAVETGFLDKLGVGDWDYKDWGTAGNLGLGAGQLGLGLASYFDTAKTAKIQRNLLNQQYASNAEAIADRRANKEALSKIVIK